MNSPAARETARIGPLEIRSLIDSGASNRVVVWVWLRFEDGAEVVQLSDLGAHGLRDHRRDELCQSRRGALQRKGHSCAAVDGFELVNAFGSDWPGDSAEREAALGSYRMIS
jgi:hypothetical protein